MSVYARTDIKSITVGPTGHTHKAKPNTQLVVTCPVCEPELVKMGWATDPRKVELTPDQIADQELEEREIQRFQLATVREQAKTVAERARRS